MAAFAPIALLFASNIFMTFAWYGQLKFPNAVLWQVVLISWGIAFFEYCLAFPAARPSSRRSLRETVHWTVS